MMRTLSRLHSLLSRTHRPKQLTHRLNSVCGSQGTHRRLLSTGTSDEEQARDEALAAFKGWTALGLGNKGCVEGYSNSGKYYEEYMKALGFSGPLKMAETVVSILKDFKDAKILDAAAGSGLSGLALHHHGFRNVDAVDASKEMLQLAETKNVYCNIFCHFLGNEPMPVEDGAYDMVVMSGAVGENHLPKSAFADLIRLVKPGGHIVNVFREAASRVPWYGDGIESYFAEQEKMGKWKQLDRIVFPNFFKDTEGVVFIHQVL